MDMMVLSIIGTVVMIVLILSGAHVGLAMMIVGFVGLIMASNFEVAFGFLRQIPFDMSRTYAFTVIPLFVLMGNAAFRSGISDGLFDFSSKWLSRMPGNLAPSSVAACTLFGAICGSPVATVATIGTVALPKMREMGYDTKLSVGCIAVSGGFGTLIPPSTVMIVYGMATGNSIGRMFASGVFPGLLMAVLLIAQIQVMLKLNPSLAPRGTTCSWIERIKSLKNLWAIVLIFGIVLIGMFSGFFTVNEAAAVGAFVSLALMAVKKKLTLENLKTVLLESAVTSGTFFILLIGGALFGRFLAMTRMPMYLASFVDGLDVDRMVIIAFVLLIYLVIGFFMEALPMVLLTVPIFYPIVVGSLGFDPIWFGCLIVMMVNLCIITPPFGLNCYVVAGVAKDIPLTTVMRGTAPFIIALSVAIVFVVVFPQIALWLPGLIFG